ncbi:Lrp/AsnC family transcriptional regulator [Membranihabitans maritimus]|uniref:Lrp/AsnC family transcriptional regulator n=1 Tax=Membranihabitans maritimus TaxID=2904244 RepID=UPI001F440AD5|nr:Lrp/AsnC family transcriptional regulator [Membranihabitans maritimus]
MKIDDFDRQIMEMLQNNARMTIKEISSNLGLSSTPVFERIKRLEKNGYIDKYVALLNRDLLGYKMVAFVQISLSLHNLHEVNSFVERITVFPEVMECYHTTGDSDFLLKILVKDMDQFNEFILNKLSNIENLGRVKTQFALSTRKRTTALDLEVDL